MKWIVASACCFLSLSLLAQSKFAQLDELLPTAGTYRTASGAPGHDYYQQQADYEMAISLNENTQRIDGDITITYTNNSPDALPYLWLQLDQNQQASNSESAALRTGTLSDKVSFNELAQMHRSFDGGFRLLSVTDAGGAPLPHTVVKTMMRVDLPSPLQPKAKATIKIRYWYPINDRIKLGGRSGYEYFEADGNHLFTIAQFFPRMCVYNDAYGWQHKQFLGAGEFTLPFGNYKVSLTVPADHVVAATGTLTNAADVLTGAQRERLNTAATAAAPVMVVMPDEARKAEKTKTTATKTWRFEAENVRDFAFATSRKFIWDAMGVSINGKTIMAMSYYPKEGMPLWDKYSTHAVAHTIKTYSKFTIPYQYPVAISVHTDRIGMEYPMICFNGGRPEPDGTYSEATKYGMISVIIHEVGHNFFPMIINSDERQWTWMDEGLNSFVQYLSEVEWDVNYPTRRGNPERITDYMKGDPSRLEPIMTNSESIKQFGNNAYGKPATALNILRETILGRELFDFAFKTYCQRWAYKHPQPADFFRSMEDASGVDLDWFWRGWFYGIEPVNLSIDAVKHWMLNPPEPQQKINASAADAALQATYLGDALNRETIAPLIEALPALNDFYNTDYKEHSNAYDDKTYREWQSHLNDEERAALSQPWNYYQLSFSNLGGLPMPLIVVLHFTDGSQERHYVPAEIWRFGDAQVHKVFPTLKTLVRAELDPALETADIDRSDNHWPRQVLPSRFDVFNSRYEQQQQKAPNPMQKAKQ